jgi:hypothetical protein
MLDEFGAEIEHADSRLDSTMKKMAKVLHLSNGNFYFSQYKPVLQIWNALILIFGRPMHFYINRGFYSVVVVQIRTNLSGSGTRIPIFYLEKLSIRQFNS